MRAIRQRDGLGDCWVVSLTPELERLIHDHIEHGCGQSASEVIRDAMQPWESDALRQLCLADMRDMIAAGLRSLDQGEGVAGEEAFDELLTGRC